MQSEAPLVIAAAAMARSAPTEWEQFIKALEHHANEFTGLCLSCSSAELADIRGRAVGVNTLFRTLNESLERAEKLTRRK